MVNFTLSQAFQILGLRPLVDPEWVLPIREALSKDSNTLREMVLAAFLELTATGGGRGKEDMRGDGPPVDAKKGPGIVFPDGAKTLSNKKDWVCLIYSFSRDKGILQYIASVNVSDIFSDLQKSAEENTKNGTKRNNPSVKRDVWIAKPSAKMIYKNPESFDTTKRGAFTMDFKKLDQLKYEPVYELAQGQFPKGVGVVG